MADVLAIPTWIGVLVAVGTPVMTFAGVLLANYLSRKGALELEARSRREETMRSLRWAAELAVSDDPGKANLGLAELNALGLSALSDNEQQVFIDAALDAVLSEPEEGMQVAESGGEEVVVHVAPPSIGRTLGEKSDVPSDRDKGGEPSG